MRCLILILTLLPINNFTTLLSCNKLEVTPFFNQDSLEYRGGGNDYIMYFENPFVFSKECDFYKEKVNNITIAFWNIEYWPGGMSEFQNPTKSEAVGNHIVAVKNILDRENPAILIASEIYNYPSTLFLNQNLDNPYPNIAVTAYQMDNENFMEIEKYDDMESQGSPTRSTAGRRHEHAIFSRFPFENTIEVEILEVGEDQVQPRGFIIAKVMIGENPVWVYGVHSTAGGRWAQFRAEKPQLLIEDIRNRNLDPDKDRIIICGDFNMDLHRDDHRPFFEPFFQYGFNNAHKEIPYPARITKPSSDIPGIIEGGPTIDYMFVSNSLQGIIRSAEIVKDSAGARPAEKVGRDPGIPSDHKMLKIELILK